MTSFEDHDPRFEPGDGPFILVNVAVGALIGWLAAGWLAGILWVLAWCIARTAFSRARDSHLPFVARAMARGEHGAVHPALAHYLAVFLASLAGTAVGGLGSAIVRSSL